ncbi:MAG: hypothetical protein Q9184_007909 [Pyrenodesmia sp. 2 TL-2023]
MPALPITVVTPTGNMTLPIIISSFLKTSDVRSNPTLTTMDKTFWVTGMYCIVFAFPIYALYITYLILICFRHYLSRRSRRSDREYEEFQIKQIKEVLDYDSTVDLPWQLAYNPGGFHSHPDQFARLVPLENKLLGDDARGLVSNEKHGHDEKFLSTRFSVQDDSFRGSFSGYSDKLIDAPIIEHSPENYNLTPEKEDLKSKQNEGPDLAHYLAPLLHEFDDCADCQERQKDHITKMKEVLGYDSAAELPGRFEYNQDGFLFHPDKPSVTDHDKVTYELNGFRLVRFDYTLPLEGPYPGQQSFEACMSSHIDNIVNDDGCGSRLQLEGGTVITRHGFSFFPTDSIRFVEDKAAAKALQTGDDGQFGDLMAEFVTWVREDVVSFYDATHCEAHAQYGICQSCGLEVKKPIAIPSFLLSEDDKSSA